MGMGVEMMRLLESIGRSERKYFVENFHSVRRCPTIIDVIHRGEAESPVDVVGLHGVRNTLNAHYALVEFNPVGNDGIRLGNVDLLEVLTLIPGFAQPYTLILAAVSAGKADRRAFVKGYTGVSVRHAVGAGDLGA